MRFHLQKDKQVQTPAPLLDASWLEAPAPGEAQIQNYGLLASCVGMFVIGAILQGEFAPKELFAAVLILVLAAPVYELLHAFTTPGWGLSSRTVFGFRQYRGLWTPYVAFDGKQLLWRFLLTGQTPTILLTLLSLMAVVFSPLGVSLRTTLGFLAFSISQSPVAN